MRAVKHASLTKQPHSDAGSLAPADIRAQSDEQRLYVVPPDGRAGGATEDRAERLLMSTVQSVYVILWN